jgi:hypothetical protein
MLADVEAALAWCRAQQRAAAEEDENAPRLRVVLAAQSAGAHLCALHLARRGWHEEADGAASRPGATAGDETSQHEAAWLPDRFVALSGVFDIAAHFAHERTKGRRFGRAGCPNTDARLAERARRSHRRHAAGALALTHVARNDGTTRRAR